MDGTLILEQYTILTKITSFSKPFKNIGLKSTLPLVLPTLLGIMILILLHLYYRAVTCLNSAISSIF
jgi:hypothetical protein